MLILLDTIILVRYLSGEVIPALEIMGNDIKGHIAASTMSAGEIVRMHGAGKLVLSVDLQRWLDAAQSTEMIRWIPVYPHVSMAAEQMENCPEEFDFYDRLIVATSKCFNVPLITGNRTILNYGGCASVDYKDKRALTPFWANR